MFNKLFNLFKSEPVVKKPELNSAEVAAFYNTNTDKFLAVYGDIIQAFRTNDVNDYLDYTISNAELKDGQKILDAGCGVGGPASYFASKINREVEGITIYDVQYQKAVDAKACEAGAVAACIRRC